MKNELALGAVAVAMFGLLPGAFGQYSESFESGTPDGWNLDAVNGSTPAVNTVRASDGIYSVQNTFAVSGSFASYSVSTLMDNANARGIINANTTTLSLDAFVNWANPAGWGVYGNNIDLVLNYQGGYQVLAPTTGSIANGSFQTLTYNVSAYAAAMSSPSLTYSQIAIAWFVGTYSDNNNGNGYLPSGTQDISIDHITTAVAVPEPATTALVAAGGAGLLCFRRRAAR